MNRLLAHQIDTTGAVDGDVLTYSSGTDTYGPAPQSGGGGGGGSAYTFDGSSTTAGVNKNASASGTHSGKSWIVWLNVAVKLTGIRLDIRTSSTYTVKIDGVTVYSGTIAPGLDVLVTFASPTYLDAGGHLVEVSCASSVLHYYFDSSSNQYAAALGAGGQYVTRWEPPLEGGSHFGARLVFVPGVFAP